MFPAAHGSEKQISAGSDSRLEACLKRPRRQVEHGHYFRRFIAANDRVRVPRSNSIELIDIVKEEDRRPIVLSELRQFRDKFNYYGQQGGIEIRLNR
jgi:hypothetical protein